MKTPYDVVLKPVISEKSMEDAQVKKYTFKVAVDANKTEVKIAVEKLFNVKVEKVNIVNVRPKKRRVGRYEGFKPSMKKAIVTLAEGQTIEKFEV